MKDLRVAAKAYLPTFCRETRKNRTLADQIADMMKWYGLSIELCDKKYKKLRKTRDQGRRPRETANEGIYVLQYSAKFERFAHLLNEFMVPCHVCKSLKLEDNPVQRVRLLQQHLNEHQHLRQECTDEDMHMLNQLAGITENLKPQEGEYVEVMDRGRLLEAGEQQRHEIRARLEELSQHESETNVTNKLETKLKNLIELIDWAASAACDEAGLVYKTMQYGFANSDELGRLYYSLDGPGCQNIPSAMRKGGCGTTMHDVDINNANPSIEIQMIELNALLVAAQRLSAELAEELRWEHEADGENCPVKDLRYYVDNREDVFQQVIEHYELDSCCDDPRGIAKSLFIRLLFGGQVERWLMDNKIEFQNKEHLDIVRSFGRINDKVVDKFKRHPVYMKAFSLKKRVLEQQRAHQVPKSEWKSDNSAIAWAVQTEENKILMVMQEFFRRRDWEVCVLIFDGLMVRRKADSVVIDGSTKYRRMDPQLLRDCEACILEETGYKIGLSEKDMLQKNEIVEHDTPLMGARGEPAPGP